ncbi:right-handed parallel beta-helix repeat-containing protein [Planktotalea sp.]|uniref:right-handed parallel beta-helix repeat-containing protein n=1 Tax=Planktotalea sp. TaxID=2029877 RepID=UPI003297F828
MAKLLSFNLRAAFIALILGLAPIAGLANVTDIDLSKLRNDLRAIKLHVQNGISEPADVAAYWAHLSVLEQDLRAGKPADEMFVPLAGARAVQQEVDLTNFRLMLSTLLHTYTGENAQGVVNAQGERGSVALSVRKGVVTLDDVRAYSIAFGLPPLSDGTLTAPVVIWPGATLRLSPGERLAMARDKGAFILAMGTLDVNGAVIESTGPENIHTPSFTPFVTVASGGSLLLKNAIVRDLGFGRTEKFSGISVAGNLLQQGAAKVSITDSLFDGLKNLTLAGVTNAEVSGNTFFNVRDNALSIVNAPKTTVNNNLFASGAMHNAIRVDKGSSETQISNNIFLAGERVAILVRGGSDRVQVSKNLIWQRAGAGIKFLQTQCGLVRDNILLDNRQKGIEIRKSNGTVVAGNLIAGHGSAGIWVSAKSAGARTSLKENVLISNRAGLSVATGGEILMDRNNFKRQLPRLLDGDIRRLTPSIAADLGGIIPLRIKDGSTEPAVNSIGFCGSDL